MVEWSFSPSKHVPFRDVAALERVRKIKREDLTRHPNPDFRISIHPDDMIGFMWVTDMFARIKEASDAGRKIVIITPNPCPVYAKVVYLINKFRVNCRNVYTFNMDEYANEHGAAAPEDWPLGFMHAFKKYFWSRIDEDLRMPEQQCKGPSDKNIKDYSRMIADAGEADICYSGPGWTGHLAFIEPDAPEFDAPLEEWKKMGARICTLSPFTLAQNSMHGSFGKSGDIAAVPPMAATIGPRDVIASKNRIDINAITVHGTSTSWQRIATRLAAHGPVTPRVPTSLHQHLRTDFWISESAAADIEPDWVKEY